VKGVHGCSVKVQGVYNCSVQVQRVKSCSVERKDWRRPVQGVHQENTFFKCGISFIGDECKECVREIFFKNL
jgi:hypothetical protein